MAAPRRGFEIPHGPIAHEDGTPTQAMLEWMDVMAKFGATSKTAADAMETLDPSATTASGGANAWEFFRTEFQKIE